MCAPWSIVAGNPARVIKKRIRPHRFRNDRTILDKVSRKNLRVRSTSKIQLGTMSLPVSVCIPVRNEEANLPDCLASVSAFPEVVVVDSRSSDGTVGIAEQAGAQVLQFDWNGAPPKKRTWTLRQHRFKHPWVLFLDADERVVPEFVTELESTLPRTSHVGFWISFVNTFMGRDLLHGDLPA